METNYAIELLHALPFHCEWARGNMSWTRLGCASKRSSPHYLATESDCSRILGLSDRVQCWPNEILVCNRYTISQLKVMYVAHGNRSLPWKFRGFQSRNLIKMSMWFPFTYRTLLKFKRQFVDNYYWIFLDNDIGWIVRRSNKILYFCITLYVICGNHPVHFQFQPIWWLI